MSDERMSDAQVEYLRRALSVDYQTAADELADETVRARAEESRLAARVEALEVALAAFDRADGRFTTCAAYEIAYETMWDEALDYDRMWHVAQIRAALTPPSPKETGR